MQFFFGMLHCSNWTDAKYLRRVGKIDVRFCDHSIMSPYVPISTQIQSGFWQGMLMFVVKNKASSVDEANRWDSIV